MHDIPFKPFHFMRHGQTDWNVRKLCMGSTDIPLNENGRAQAQGAAKYLANEKIELIVSSPQLRALETAQIVSAIIQKPVSIIHNLRECCWGDREGQPIDHHAEAQWRAGHLDNGSEALEHFDMRIKNTLIQVLSLSANVLMVSHSGVYRAIQRTLCVVMANVHNCAVLHHKPEMINAKMTWVAENLIKEELLKI